MPGSKCVIVGSGDIGLIMARRDVLGGGEGQCGGGDSALSGRD